MAERRIGGQGDCYGIPLYSPFLACCREGLFRAGMNCSDSSLTVSLLERNSKSG
jgi:hypothetical protein